MANANGTLVIGDGNCTFGLQLKQGDATLTAANFRVTVFVKGDETPAMAALTGEGLFQDQVDARDRGTWPATAGRWSTIHHNLPWPDPPQPNFAQNKHLQNYVLKFFKEAEAHQQEGDKVFVIIQVTAQGPDFYQKWYGFRQVLDETAYKVTAIRPAPMYDFDVGSGVATHLTQFEFTHTPQPASAIVQGVKSTHPSMGEVIVFELAANQLSDVAPAAAAADDAADE